MTSQTFELSLWIVVTNTGQRRPYLSREEAEAFMQAWIRHGCPATVHECTAAVTVGDQVVLQPQ